MARPELSVDHVDPGVICLQGGREFTPACDGMDRLVIERAKARTGNARNAAVAVLAGAARVGADYAGASARARSHYGRLGASVTVIADPRTDLDRALHELAQPIDLLVLPGGSPAGLVDVLTGAVGRAVIDRHAAGMAVSGASAGAMVLCTHTMLPDRGGNVAAGLGLVDGVALPHWSPGSSRGWSLPDADVWGLPECGGVLIHGSSIVAVGAGEPAIRRGGRWRLVPR